jgi:flagellar motor switch protein FliM
LFSEEREMAVVREGREVFERVVKEYDFRHPDKFSKDQLRTLEMLHESFARLCAAGLSTQLRTIVQARVSGVSQLTYSEVIRSISSPAVLAIFSMEPLEGEAFIELEPKLIFTIIDRLLGGRGEAGAVTRELTDIELTVVENIISRFLVNFKETWASTTEIRPKLSHIESNPQFTQITSPGDIVVLIILELTIGEMKGRMSICIPYVSLEPIIGELSSQQRYATSSKKIPIKRSEKLRKRMENVPVPLIAELGTTQILVREMLELTPGDVIKLDGKIGDDLILKVGNQPKFKCKPGLSGTKMAVQISEVIREIPLEISSEEGEE